MRRSVAILLGVATLLLLGSASPTLAQRKYPVSVGFTYGTWNPSLDGYNSMFLDQTRLQAQENGREVAIRSAIDTDKTYGSLTTGAMPFLFESSWGYGFNARLRLHNDVFAMFEYDWWQQKVAHERLYHGIPGYERYEVKLNPVLVSLVYQLPTEASSRWWPKVYLGGGAGAVTVSRTNTQVYSTTDGWKSLESSGSGSGFIYQGMTGVEFVIPFSFLRDRLSLFFEARYVGGGFNDSAPALEADGSPIEDENNLSTFVPFDVSVAGASMKFGMNINFGEIRNRPEKGVLTGFLEQRSRRSGGFAMAPMPGYGGGGGGGGVTIVYPQTSDQVQVVEGAPQIDEDRLRQIIRDELMTSRMSAAGGASRSVDTLAEEQLRNVRLRRLQALEELEQLKELLREEG